MKWTISLFVTIFLYLTTLYIIWIFSQGTFDISIWTVEARETISIVGGFGSLVIVIIKIFIS